MCVKATVDWNYTRERRVYDGNLNSENEKIDGPADMIVDIHESHFFYM